MSGEEKSIKERLERMNELLDNEELEIGLPKFNFANSENDAAHILTMPYSVMSKLSSIECGEKAWVLREFSFHLQRAVNRKQAEIRWANECITKEITPKLAGTPGYSVEERRINACRGNDACEKYQAVVVNASLRVERLAFLSSKIDQMAHTLFELFKSKRKQGDDE